MSDNATLFERIEGHLVAATARGLNPKRTPFERSDADDLARTLMDARDEIKRLMRAPVV